MPQQAQCWVIVGISMQIRMETASESPQPGDYSHSIKWIVALP